MLTMDIDQMNKDPHAKQSWVAEGDLEKMMQTFADFPTWVKNIFKYDSKATRIFLRSLLTIHKRHSADLGLWQLRDLVGSPIKFVLCSSQVQDPLKTWHRGRVIIIGDAAHAMLPTQGQGASQAIEDSEALGAFFDEIIEPPSPDVLTKALEVRNSIE
jgi:salicylate hydroxylase